MDEQTFLSTEASHCHQNHREARGKDCVNLELLGNMIGTEIPYSFVFTLKPDKGSLELSSKTVYCIHSKHRILDFQRLRSRIRNAIESQWSFLHGAV